MWYELTQSRGSSRMHLLSIRNIACGQQMAAWKFERTGGRNFGWAPQAIFGLKLPPKTWHGFALSVITGTDNQ